MIAREAFWYLVPVVLAALLLQLSISLLAIPFWLLVALLMYLFRTPETNLSSEPLAIVCPVNSTVSDISYVTDPYLKREAVRIDFVMALTDVYNLLSVTEGKIMNFWMWPPEDKEAKTKTKLRTVWIQTDEKDDVVMEVHPTRSGQLMCYSAAGERVGQGKKCGFLPFGSKVVVYLPKESVLEIKQGDRVMAGVDIIAHWPRS